jgi:hypothetical protein
LQGESKKDIIDFEKAYSSSEVRNDPLFSCEQLFSFPDDEIVLVSEQRKRRSDIDDVS